MQVVKIFDRKFFAPHKTAALLVALCLTSTPVVAQHWATADACRIEDPRIIESAFGPDLAFINQMAAQEINGIGRLWKITSTEGAVSHLWGTYHSNDPTILDLPPEMDPVLSQAKVVATEYNPIPTSRRIIERQYSDERLWRSLRTSHRFSLPNKDVEGWVKTRARALGYSERSLDTLSNLGIAEALLGDPCNDFLNGIFPIQDDRILLLGADAGAELTGLEPYDAFRTTLSRRDYQDVARAMIEVYGAYLNPENAKDGRSTSYALYQRGELGVMRAWDTAYITRIYGQDRGAELLALVDGYLVVERNQTFLQTALPLINDGGAVFAVGAFHLPGPSGMIELIRNAGHTVERVVTTGEIP